MKILIGAIIAVVAAAIVAGFFLVGSPMDQRARQLDERRVSDLQMIQSQILSYWLGKGKLPANLSDTDDSINGFNIPTDPQTKASYGYAIKGEHEFELCADFATANNEATSPRYTAPAVPYGYMGVSENWTHIAGHVCFERSIDKDFYPPKSQGIPAK